MVKAKNGNTLVGLSYIYPKVGYYNIDIDEPSHHSPVAGQVTFSGPYAGIQPEFIEYRIDSGEWIFGLSHQRVALWNPDSNQLLLEQSNGPIQDALRTEEGWLITGWREDLIWHNGKLETAPRNEIGLHLMNHSEHGYIVLEGESCC